MAGLCGWDSMAPCLMSTGMPLHVCGEMGDGCVCAFAPAVLVGLGQDVDFAG